jgi:leucyl/phenylalanyl-tRNA--protein transferase
MGKATDLLLEAYREGIFPMAETVDDDSFAFYKPHMRGLLPIRDLHIPSKLLKKLRHDKDYSVTINRDFEAIIDGCAAATKKRDKTWINRPIRDFFVQLHREGHAHSVEAWDAEGELMGGLYGLGIGAVFCGESMVSFQKDGSKIALVYLCALLWKAGYTVLDTQFINPHLLQFGAYEMPQQEYETMIRTEMKKETVPFSSLTPDRTLLEAYHKNRKLPALDSYF